MKTKILLISLFIFGSKFATSQNFSLDFDGSEDLVTSPVMSDTLHTIEFWLKSDNSIDGTALLSLPLNFATNSQWISLNNSSSFITGETVAINKSISAPSATNQAVSLGWHHYAFTSNGTTYNKIYIDGVAAPMISTSSLVFSNTHLDLGYRTLSAPAGALPYAGKIDELRIWKVIKTQAEIVASMNTELTGGEPNLILYYKFDNTASICDVEDCSPYGNHGVRTGINFANNLPQYSTDVPSLTVIQCTAGIGCSASTLENTSHSNFEINVFPNPSGDKISVSFSKNVNNATLRLLNVTGQKVYEKLSLNGNHFDIEIASLSNGIYIIQIEQEGSSIRKKLIVNK